MRKTKVNGIEFQLYEDIEELPVKNWSLFNDYSMLNSGVGYSIQDCLDHVERICLFIDKDNREGAMQERMNLHQCAWNQLRGLNYNFLQLSTLDARCLNTEVESYGVINYDIAKHLDYAGEKMDEFQKLASTFDKCLKEDKKEALLHIYSSFKAAMKQFFEKNSKRSKIADKFTTTALEAFRDPIMKQLQVAFPSQFSNSSELNYYSELKKKVIYDLKYIIEGAEKYKMSSSQIQDYFLTLMKPKNFNGHDHENVIMQQKLALHKLYVALMQRGVKDPEAMSIMSFYTAIDYFANKKQ